MHQFPRPSWLPNATRLGPKSSAYGLGVGFLHDGKNLGDACVITSAPIPSAVLRGVQVANSYCFASQIHIPAVPNSNRKTPWCRASSSRFHRCNTRGPSTLQRLARENGSWRGWPIPALGCSYTNATVQDVGELLSSHANHFVVPALCFSRYPASRNCIMN